jgi:hypothetical protein
MNQAKAVWRRSVVVYLGTAVDVNHLIQLRVPSTKRWLSLETALSVT